MNKISSMTKELLSFSIGEKATRFLFKIMDWRAYFKDLGEGLYRQIPIAVEVMI